MTFKEKLQMEHPEKVDPSEWGGCVDCPSTYGYEEEAYDLCDLECIDSSRDLCATCWNREMPEEKSESKKAVEHGEKVAEGFKAGMEKTVAPEKIYEALGIKQPGFVTPYILDKDNIPEIPPLWPKERPDFRGKRAEAGIIDEYCGPEMPTAEEIAEYAKADARKILDSGNRREFESGAVRDIQEGKGRCDLLPLDVVAEYGTQRMSNKFGGVLYSIDCFKEENNTDHLHTALDFFCHNHNRWDGEDCTMLLEVAKHFEEGCKKYGENNWQKGIPTHCYIDSAVRHYLKYLRGDTDEPHDRAFCWNILCCIWTCKHKPELNDYRKDSNENEK